MVVTPKFSYLKLMSCTAEAAARREDAAEELVAEEAGTGDGGDGFHRFYFTPQYSGRNSTFQVW